MTANVFGTPIYVSSGFDGKDSPSKKDGGSSMTGRLKDVLKALQPLEKAISGIESAIEALDGTGYEEIRKALKQCKGQIEAKLQEIVGQISNGPQTQQKPAAPETQLGGNPVPTAGQIAGTEPLSN